MSQKILEYLSRIIRNHKKNTYSRYVALKNSGIYQGPTDLDPKDGLVSTYRGSRLLLQSRVLGILVTCFKLQK
jgi:hypothetical protein